MHLVFELPTGLVTTALEGVSLPVAASEEHQNGWFAVGSMPAVSDLSSSVSCAAGG